MRRLPVAFGVLLLCLGLSSLAACGKKGPVRPLLKPLPEAPGAMAARQQGGTVLLSWTIPVRNQDASPLTDLQGFALYRMEYDPVEGCPDCREPSDLLEEVDLDYLREAMRSENRLFLRDSATETGRGYRYRLVPLTRSGREGASASAQLAVVSPPPPPEGLLADGRDRMIRLSWSPLCGDGETCTYNIYRRGDGEAPSVIPLNRVPLTESVYDDYKVENGKRYLYAVRSVTGIEGAAVESEPTPFVEATPVEGR